MPAPFDDDPQDDAEQTIKNSELEIDADMNPNNESVDEDIVSMSEKVSAYIETLGNPNEKKLYTLLQEAGHAYTRKQARQ